MDELTEAGPNHQESGIISGSKMDGDVEKDAPVLAPKSELQSPTEPMTSTSTAKQYLKSFERTLIRFNLEERGIERVPPEHRHSTQNLGFLQISLLWIGINLTANNITLGMLGPAVFYLPFLDCCLCAVFGMIVGCLPVAYIATFGPRSGNRTMVFTRYIFGWYPSKLIVVLSLIILLGYSLLDVIIAGQMLSAVSPNGSLSIVVGIIITAIITWAITTFGYSIFHYYERFAWLPQLMAVMILFGCAGPRFDLYANPGAGESTRTVVGNRLSFFSLCLSAAITYSTAGCDFFVYYPESASRTKIFITTVTGLYASFTPMFILGIGLGSGIVPNSNWESAYSVSQGALIVEGFRPLGAFGSFCAVLIALGLISNLVAPTYAGGIDWQALGWRFERVPRVVWNTLSVVIYTVCAIAGRGNLATIFTNYLALMGYWVSIWIAIVLEEHLIFRKARGLSWVWENWNEPRKLPIGIAALVAFLIGWVGAILCMAQVWYIGPIAATVGDFGADVSSRVLRLSSPC